MLAFAGLPKMELPAYSREERSPGFSNSALTRAIARPRALKKVAMFNAGEVETMREVGLGPIFLRSGADRAELAHLTYMAFR